MYSSETGSCNTLLDFIVNLLTASCLAHLTLIHGKTIPLEGQTIATEIGRGSENVIAGTGLKYILEVELGLVSKSKGEFKGQIDYCSHHSNVPVTV